MSKQKLIHGQGFRDTKVKSCRFGPARTQPVSSIRFSSVSPSVRQSVSQSLSQSVSPSPAAASSQQPANQATESPAFGERVDED
ncbi:hypothetical protein BO99DRAFT_45410 [Aspergillus violaceofuscus CBS 115571]|uniref:Uncharacterized protein n=1 Tax=Aspergillus violaceofuscus (strain CBS 115571) TaxID=1450538 RepID=A0A2V5GRY7_ASPV1|nr:hypothetical protein BO99DRAFT_45410 [Aspergillus violaceofuscus CBS 115571]